MVTGILGLGLTGQSVSRYLTKKQETFSVWDRKNIPNEDQDNSFLAWAKSTQRIYISPGVCPNRYPYNQIDRNRYTNDIEEFLQRCPSKNLIAVTGTNGKTSVVTLLKELLVFHGETCFSMGNNEVPPLDHLDSIKPTDWVVLELSSFQLATLSKIPKLKAALITSFSEDHLDWHPDLKDYKKCKDKIFSSAQYCLAPADFFSSYNTIAWDTSYVLDFTKSSLFLEKKILGPAPSKIIGSPLLIPAHQVLQTLCLLGFDLQTSLQGLASWEPLPHRFEKMTLDDIEWINDSKATNVGASLAAFSCLPACKGPTYAIMGGLAKGQDLSPLAQLLGQVDKFFLIGDSSVDLKKILGSKAEIVDTLPSFFEKLKAYPKPARVVLSPACASLDQFDNYKHRGQTFFKEVCHYCTKSIEYAE